MRGLITESLLSDAREIDGFVREHGPRLPSVEATLRIVREIDPETFRRIGRDVWGTGQTDGAAELSKCIDACTEHLVKAANEASAWTGDANNTYTARINSMKNALGEMRAPVNDVGQKLVELADGFEFKVADLWNNIFSLVGVILGLLGVIAGIIVGVTGIGAIIGLILGVLGLLVGIAAWWLSLKFKADEQIAKCNEASATAVKTVESLGKIKP